MSFSVSEIVSFVEGRLINSVELKAPLDAVADLSEARDGEIAFYISREYRKALSQSKASVVITNEVLAKDVETENPTLWGKAAVIVCKDPYFALALLSQKYALLTANFSHPVGPKETEIHPTAILGEGVEIGKGVRIGPFCQIGNRVVLGDGVILHGSVTIAEGVKIGQNSILFPQVTLYSNTTLGNRVRIHAGAVIGADGFGYALNFQSGRPNGHQKIYHSGGVVICDDVEIGANACVDRGTFGLTQIGRFAKLDNLVQIGHNVQVEEGAIICGGALLAGGVKVGKYVYMGGYTGVANQVVIGDGAKVGAGTLLSKDVPAGETAVGIPQRDYKSHFRAHAALNKLIRTKNYVKERTKNEQGK